MLSRRIEWSGSFRSWLERQCSIGQGIQWNKIASEVSQDSNKYLDGKPPKKAKSINLREIETVLPEEGNSKPLLLRCQRRICGFVHLAIRNFIYIYLISNYKHLEDSTGRHKNGFEVHLVTTRDSS